MAERPRILVVDQDPDGCNEIQQLLAKSRLIVIGGVGYEQEAVSLASEVRPQVVLLSLAPPVDSALETVRSLARAVPEAPIVTYSGLDDIYTIRRASAFGARDHVARPLSAEALTSAIERVLAGPAEPAVPGEVTPPDRYGGAVVTVFGPKGGIGRTLVSVNLAASLAKAGLTCVLVDLDTASGDVARRMGLKAGRGLVEAALHAGELDELTVDAYLTPHASGVKVLPAPLEPTDWREIDSEAVDRLLTLLPRINDFVIVDTPAAFTDLSLRALHRADVVLLLASLDRSSIEMGGVALRMLAASQPAAANTRLVLNHLTEAKRPSDDEAAQELGREVFWSLPWDESIAYRDDDGRPAVICKRKAKISRAISEMAAALAKARSPAGAAA